ncbi:MAG: membrane integrity-associated transporter subunit PqiC [Sulfurovum sp.]|nr:membrane integrity-associated transporter subunit PqiC [Sulfurovaceae bacterium]
MRKYIILILSSFLVGCTTTSNNYFIFKEPIVTGEYKRDILPTIGLEKILLPEYMQQSKIVIQTSPSNIKYLEDNLWAENMENSLTKKLISIIQKSFNNPRVYSYPWGVATEPTIRISILVNRFIYYNGYIYLAGSWNIKREADYKNKLFDIKIATESDIKNIVSNMNIAFDKLSHQIVIELSHR